MAEAKNISSFKIEPFYFYALFYAMLFFLLILIASFGIIAEF